MDFLQIANLHFLSKRLKNTCEEVPFLVKLYARSCTYSFATNELLYSCFSGK